MKEIQKFENKTTYDENIIRFGDVLVKFGGLNNLNLFKLIDYMHKYFVGKEVLMYLKLEEVDQVRIRNIINFTVEIQKWEEDGVFSEESFSYKFKLHYEDGKCLIMGEDAIISILNHNKN